VVGHVEWVTFARVPAVPAAGEIARARESWDEAAGGGAVAAAEMTRLAGSREDAHFFTAVGDDETARNVLAKLEAHGHTVFAATRAAPHPRVITFLDDDAERTITVLAPPLAPRGDDALPWTSLDDVDAVYFCKGDAAAVREARRARVLVATARVLPVLREARVHVDVLVRSANDPGEAYALGDLDPLPAVVVATEGGDGGSFETAAGKRGRFRAVPIDAPLADAYGAGDSFAAALTWALGERRALEDALAFAAARAALALTRRGA
jgi:ribokinase